MTPRQQVEQAIREVCKELKDAIESEGGNGYIVEDGPIHLEHVMRAIDKNTSPLRVKVSSTGELLYQEFFNKGYGFYVYSPVSYDLFLPFSEQSDELINFLHPILCAKE